MVFLLLLWFLLVGLEFCEVKHSMCIRRNNYAFSSIQLPFIHSLKLHFLQALQYQFITWMHILFFFVNSGLCQISGTPGFSHLYISVFLIVFPLPHCPEVGVFILLSLSLFFSLSSQCTFIASIAIFLLLHCPHSS